MRSPCLLLVLVVLMVMGLMSHTASALVTLDTIREVTVRTEEARGMIEGFNGGESDGKGSFERSLREGQVVLGDEADVGVKADIEITGHGDGEGERSRRRAEIVVSQSLQSVYSSLSAELEKDLDGLRQDPITDQHLCDAVVSDFHSLLRETTLFLYAVQEKQMRWKWKRDSKVYESLEGMQRLWASRSGNSQNRSFIEQQLALYKATTCFGKAINHQVLRRDVEIVEYLNELIDMFEEASWRI